MNQEEKEKAKAIYDNESDNTKIIGNKDSRGDLQEGDTLARDFGSGFRDLKVHLPPKKAGVQYMKDGSQEDLYMIVVRRRRIDLGE